MIKATVIGGGAILATLGAGMCTPTADPLATKDLGRSAKLAILVDKVMQRQAGWKTEEWMVKKTADAGFNVYSPRRGHQRLDEVKRVTEWCRKYGIYHIPWMRGTLRAPDGPEADGKRVVWASGNEQPLWSPNSEEFWEWTSKYIIEYAKISAQNRHLIGVFLDYENYAPGEEGHLYALSYDDVIMSKFAGVMDLNLPELPHKKRRSWLESQGLHKQFEEFQIAQWRARCRALRKAIDELNPTFHFCIYPAPGTPFIVEAVYPEWATKTAPLILADASVYGRSSRFLPHDKALEVNRRKLLERMQVPGKKGIPFVYAGGIDPLAEGADPEFSGKNAVMIADVTDGYWVFYEGPTYGQQSHDDYWKWFTWANKAIGQRKFAKQHEPRETPEDLKLEILDRSGGTSRLAAPATMGTRTRFPFSTLRRANTLLIAGKAGLRIELVVRNQPVSRHRGHLVWNLHSPKRTKLDSGTIPSGGTGTVAFTSDTDGIYLLGLSAGLGAYSVISSNVPVGFYAGKKLSFIRGVKRLYFQVPSRVGQFTLEARGYGSETVRVNVYDTDQQLAASGQTTHVRKKIGISVLVGDRPAGTWSLEITRADEGVLEDNSIKLGPEIPPVLSLVPEHVFRFYPPE